MERSGKTGCALEMSQVRNQIERLLKEMKEKASKDTHLANQYELMELPIIFFTDSMIYETKMSFANQWRSLAAEKNELAGDEKFFDLLEDDLADPGDDAKERLAVYYTCMGLGFTGIYTGQEEEIRRFMLKISSRISDMMDTDERALICPESYENVDTRDLIEPPGAKLMGIGIAFIGLVIVWFLACFYLFKITSQEVNKNIKSIEEVSVNQSSIDNAN